MKSAPQASTQLSAGIVSPFADTQAAVPRHPKTNRRFLLWAGLSILFLAVAAIGVITSANYLKDPYRTLELFPVSKYLSGYRSLAGSRFKADLRVETDLGWKEGIGRLMLFSFADEPRPIAVMVPAIVAKDIHFTKGQGYLAELEVKEGGLIYANSCRKN